MINRLLGIIYILMRRGTVTAAELAERFEVSARTIYRDMDTLGAAGIPIYAKKGKNGGICLTEQFILDKMLLTKDEQQEILSGLVSLRETKAEDGEDILLKLGDFFVRIRLTGWRLTCLTGAGAGRSSMRTSKQRFWHVGWCSLIIMERTGR